MGATHFSGPVISGTLGYGDTLGPNQGNAVLDQAVAVSYDATLVQSSTFYIPAGSRILNFTADVLTAYNSATSATLSVGITAGGTEYVASVNVKAATGRIAITFTAAQLAAMNGTSIVGAAAAIAGTVIATVTSVGQPTAGYVVVNCNYVQQ
jgi:hypothetical protein